MDKEIEKILEDLFRAEPELKAREAELKSVLARLIAERPVSQMDPIFREELRAVLTERFREAGRKTFAIQFLRTAPFLAGVALTLLVFFGVSAVKNYPNEIALSPEGGVNLESKILEKEEKAFGEITGELIGPPILGMGAGDAQNKLTSPLGAAGADNRKFTYAGERVALDRSFVPVLEKAKGDALDQYAKSISSTFELNQPVSFSGTKINSVELTQDKDFGYKIGINLEEGVISVSPNLRYWGENTTSEGSAERRVFSDTEILEISENFLKDHSIPMDNYYEPKIISETGSTTAEVIFPAKIESKAVYNESGEEEGLVMTVNLEVGKVWNILSISLPVYSSSQYPALTDWEKAVSSAEAGGLNKNIPSGGELGTPKEGWTKVYSSKESRELYIPALIFPVLGEDANIPVPLLKDF